MNRNPKNDENLLINVPHWLASTKGGVATPPYCYKSKRRACSACCSANHRLAPSCRASSSFEMCKTEGRDVRRYWLSAEAGTPKQVEAVLQYSSRLAYWSVCLHG